MKQNQSYKETFPLTSSAVDAASARLEAALAPGLERREALRLRLAVEEVLDLWQDKLGPAGTCTVWCGARFGLRGIRLSAPGPRVDPNLHGAEDELGAAGNVILHRLGLSPTFHYEKGTNLVALQLPAKKPSQLVWIGLAMVLAIVLGLGSLSLPTHVQSLLADQLAKPALAMLMGALSAVAMPIIFFSICISIMNIGDVATLGKIGKKFLLQFLVLTFVTSAVNVLGVFWLFPLSGGSAGGTAGFEGILAMLFAVVPTNLVSPFIEANVLQIIFLSGCFGVAFLMLGERVSLLGQGIRELDQALSLLMRGINGLIPVFVFLTFYSLAASGTLARLGGAVRILVLVAVSMLLLLLLLSVIFSVRMRLPVGVFLPKLLPAFLISLSTASSAASYPTRLESCKKRLGVEERTAHFSVPLAQALFKPSGSVLYCCSALCIAQEYGVSITPGWLVLCVVVASILAIATPPVVGGSKMAFAALFAQLGLPTEGLVIVLAVEGVADFLMTAFNSYMQMVLIVLCCDELELVDRTVLASRN